MFKKLLENHVLTNLAFLLLLVIGWLAYYQLPREQDPSINFNWVQIWTFWPGATATDIERRITDPLEEAVERVKDIKFTSSTSREGVSSILVRFDDLNEEQFDNRVADLRRELQAKQDELPDDIDNPLIEEISSSNAFPTAMLAVWTRSTEESLQEVASTIREDLARVQGVVSVSAAGASDPEIQVEFFPHRLLGLGISPVDLADTVQAYFRDLAAGDISIGDQKWLVRLTGTSSDPAFLESFPIISAGGEVPLRSLAHVRKARADARHLVRFRGQPAVLLSVFKEDKANNIVILEQINRYLETKNRQLYGTGVAVILLDDQTQATRSAISVMERNALIGLFLVLLATWLFLGFRIALFTVMGIPFALAGTFLLLGVSGQTLNVTVLLGIVISLGMLVDDAVVVVEAIYQRLRKGDTGYLAVSNALHEVGMPVVTAVLTTVAAFLPLMLLPGVLGDFMRVVPIVVSIALLMSLVDAFWILPAHILQFQPDVNRKGSAQLLRDRITHRIRTVYSRLLIKVFRRPLFGLGLALGSLAFAVWVLFAGWVRVDFFASDFFRLFYVNVEMPSGTSLEKTSSVLQRIENSLLKELQPGELRGAVNYAGLQFTDTELLIGEDKGQVFVSLNPGVKGGRDVNEIIDAARAAVLSVPGPTNVSFMRRKTGPPVAKPISIKVRGDDIQEIREAVSALKQILGAVPGIADISDDDTQGGMMLSGSLNPDAITRAGINPLDVIRTTRLFADGEVVASMQYQGEKVDVRVRARPEKLQDVETFLAYPLEIRDGGAVPLEELLDTRKVKAVGNIRHHNLRRAVTVEADLDSAVTDTLAANRAVRDRWDEVSTRYPGVDLDFSGEMDDIQDSLGAMVFLFLFGMGLIYLVLGTQFKSYIQPLMVLATVPMAFVGVVFGLFLSNNPMSLFTLYGAIALAGIAVNDAIVLISAANSYLERGRPVATAALLAGRRRAIPILITSLTTMAGLYSLASGLGGKSLMWGPVATAVIWGLGVSTLLTLFLTPLGYHALTRRKREPIKLEMPARNAPGPRFLLERFLQSGLFAHMDKGPSERQVFTSEVRELYNEGVNAMWAQDWEGAIRCFQSLAESEPGVIDFNIYAAQSHIMLMEDIGWDIGYIARARRYLARAEAIDPTDRRLVQLQKAYRDLQDQEEKDEQE